MVILHALGQCLIRTAIGTIGPRAELGFTLAARLIAERGRRFTRAQLAALFWPDTEEQKAAHSLSEALHRLRARGVPIETDASNSVWIPRGAAATDVERIPERTPADLIPCDFTVLPGFEPRGSAELVDWAEEWRHELKVRTVRGLAIAMRKAERDADWATALALAEHTLRLDSADPEALATRVRAADGLRLERTAKRASTEHANEDTRVAAPVAPLVTPRVVREPTPAPCAITVSRMPTDEGALIGRSREVDVLRDAWEQARRGRGQRVWVHGGTGVGKSRLARHLMSLVQRGGGVVADVTCLPGDSDRALATLIRLAPRLRQLPGAAGCAPDIVPYLDRLTAHDARSTAWIETVDAPYMAACVQHAIDDVVGAIAEEQPLLIVIDNAQWMDSESAGLVDALTLANAARALLVVVVAADQPEASSGGGVAPHVPLLVEALPDDAARELVNDRVRGSAQEIDDALLDWFVRAGEGNPLRLEQLINHWRETGLRFELPPTLAALLRNRLAGLLPIERRVLQVVALLGAHATLTHIERAVAAPRGDLLGALETLGSAGLLLLDHPTDAQPRLVCRHEALAEAALALLAPPARALLHRDVADALEVAAEEGRSSDCSGNERRSRSPQDPGVTRRS